MNNKGMTLIELIITIAMLSVAMVFMYGLMTNLQRKKNDNDAYTDNLMKIVDIETGIQKSLMGNFEFGREDDISYIRLWNDLWSNGSGDTYYSEVTGHYIRLDVNIDGTWYEKAIGINNKGRTIRVREKVANAEGEKEWKDMEIWKFGEEVKSVKISENCTFNKPSLHCQINLYLYDDNDKIIDSINIPLYFKTDSFWIDTTNERKCNNGINDNNVDNCVDPYISESKTSLQYSRKY